MTTTAQAIPPAEPGPLRDVVEHVTSTKARVVLVRDGHPVAAIVPIEDIETLENIEDDRDPLTVREARARWERDGLPIATLAQFAEAHGIDLADPSDDSE